MAFTRLKLTTFGQTIEAKRHQGKGIHFTRVAIGDGLRREAERRGCHIGQQPV